jgi:arylformamidase
MTKRDWIDISAPLRSGMACWPGDPPVRIELVQSIERGDDCNISSLSMSAHAGTHMEAPLHYYSGGNSMSTMPFSAAIGAARVIEVQDPESVKPAELRWHHIRCGERILFKTRGSAHYWRQSAFHEGFVYISREAAEYLAARQILTVGVDYLSVGGFRKDLEETHRILLGAGIWIIEGLDLSAVRPGRYDLICLPLRMAGCEGAPARALLRPRD